MCQSLYRGSKQSGARCNPGRLVEDWAFWADIQTISNWHLILGVSRRQAYLVVAVQVVKCCQEIPIFCLQLCFPRASERRVLLIVGLCQTFSHILIFTSVHLHIFSSSHLLIFTSSHLHICSSSHLLIFTSSHLHILTSSHFLIFTSSHLHILPSSHLLIFTSVHLHIFSSSHLLIFTSVHLHICSSSHLLIFTSSHLHILTSSHFLIFTSSHLHIFSSSHLLIFSSSYLHIFTFSRLFPSWSLALLLSCPLAASFFSISLLTARGSANETQ